MKFMSTIAGLLFLSSVQAQYIYPVPKKIPLVETRFGVQIEDPYKWMENLNDPDLWSWIEEQKAFTSGVLDGNLMDEFSKEILLVRKLREEQSKVTQKSVGLTLASEFKDDYFKHEKKKEVLRKWTKKSVFGLFTQQKESSLYKVKVQSVHSGDLLRVIISKKSDNSVVDIILVKFFTFITWADDNSFYYVSDLDQRIGGGKPGLFKHTVGEIQSEDKLLLTGKTAASDLTVHEVGSKFFVEVDGVIGSLQLDSGKVTNRHPVNGEIVEMLDKPEATAVIRSFKNANYGEFHHLRLRDGSRSVFLPEQNFVVESTQKLNDKSTLVIGLKDAAHVAGILTDGKLTMIDGLKDGTITFKSFAGNVLRLDYETYTHPVKAYAYNIETNELSLVSEQKLPYEVEVDKIYYKASNGQDASLWVVKKKGLTLTSKTPVILYGYGGFRSSITPAFGMYESLPWIQRGGVFAVVTLPGSLDYGQSWYDVAKVGGRTHSWDSFALAAKELFRRGWTSPDHIGMMGASNGGTLVAGALQRHSDIFKAAIPIVGVMDLLNFTLFTAGKYWTEDYGNPFTEKDFHTMLPLSPYHNIERRDYPATMVMTAEFDDRVVPSHSYKYAARLQEYNTSDAPILLYNKEWGAHGRQSGSARESSLYVAAFYTFFAQQLGL